LHDVTEYVEHGGMDILVSPRRYRHPRRRHLDTCDLKVTDLVPVLIVSSKSANSVTGERQDDYTKRCNISKYLGTRELTVNDAIKPLSSSAVNGEYRNDLQHCSGPNPVRLDLMRETRTDLHSKERGKFF